nr:T9SS type A sorting domain-containing protein [Bacteroidales bacterium]
MKKNLFLFVILVIAISKLYGQNYYVINFSGTGASPETVLVENLTEGTSVNMQGTDILHLNLVVGVQEFQVQNNSLKIYPNPILNRSNFEFTNTQQGRVNIQLFNTEGKLIHNYSRDLSKGIHNFQITGLPRGAYLIGINTPENHITGRFVSMSKSYTDFSLIHTGVTPIDVNQSKQISTGSNTKSNKAIVNMDYTAGDELKFTGYANGYANSSVYASPTGNQSIIFNFVLPYYRITGHAVTTDLPSFVNVMFSVKDEDFNVVDNLSISNFILSENDVTVNPDQSYPYLHTLSTMPYKVKTVLMIDKIASDENELNNIKSAALSMINNIGDNQEFAVYTFSNTPLLLQDFTDNTSLLTTAINNISLGSGLRDLYASYITGVNAWDDIYTTDLVQKGFLVMLTSGDDTQSSASLQQAIDARGQKSTYIIGLGDNYTPDVLNQLSNPAPCHTAESVNELPQIFTDIENEITLYGNSFYWLNYMSPKRSGTHTLKVEIEDNTNTNTDAYYQADFNADGFESVTSGVYVNTTPSDLYGIDELTVQANDQVNLDAVTYGANQTPVYTWSADNTALVTINPDSDFFNKAELNFPGMGGTTNITVNDIANSYSKNISLEVLGTPTLTTDTVFNITYTTATSGGNVTDNGGSSVTERGVCWSTSQNPTISDNHTTDGTGI